MYYITAECTFSSDVTKRSWEIIARNTKQKKVSSNRHKLDTTMSANRPDCGLASGGGSVNTDGDSGQTDGWQTGDLVLGGCHKTVTLVAIVDSARPNYFYGCRECASRCNGKTNVWGVPLTSEDQLPRCTTGCCNPPTCITDDCRDFSDMYPTWLQGSFSAKPSMV